MTTAQQRVEQIEAEKSVIDAEVFKIVRANQDRGKITIMRLLKETGYTHEQIAASLKRLADRLG